MIMRKVLAALVVLSAACGAIEGSDDPCGIAPCSPPGQPEPTPAPTLADAAAAPDASAEASVPDAKESACKRPYHFETDDGRCVWTCSKGTTPDPESGECVCTPGLVEVDADEYGRRICRPG